MSLESISLGVLALVLLGVGSVFVFRVETALNFQERYAEAVSWKPPSEDPAHYEDTREHRQGIFQIGGVVLLAVGTMLLAVSIYGTFFLESFPR